MSEPDTPRQIGPYELLGELGRGGMGVVYRARRPDLPRDVALKVIPATDGGLAARFLREAQAAGRLSNHPNIVGVHDAGTHGDHLYLAMDVIEGRTFEAMIAEGELTHEAAVRVVQAAARAVAAGHDAGILHRDLKPANILIDTAGHVRVADFGLARVQQASAEVTRLTKSDEIVGTPAYMAPEQALGDPTDGRADVWGLGATLHHALSGGAPFGGDSLIEILHGVLSDEPAPLPPDVPAPLRRVVACCLAKQPAHRYPTAQALADDLERWLRGEPVTARRPGVSRRGARGMAAAAVVVAAAGGLAALAAWSGRAGERAADTGRRTEAVTAARNLAQEAGAARGRLQALHARTREPFGLLLAAFYGRPLSAAERDAALAELDRAAGAAADGPLRDGWRALARYLGGAGPESAVADAAAAAGDDPFPHVLVAMAALARYARDADLPTVNMLPGQITVAPFRERDALAQARRTADGALARAQASPLWSALEDGTAPRAFVQGAQQLAKQEYAAAAAALRRAGEDPLFGPPAAALAGLAAYLDGDLEAAARDWTAAGDGEWPDMLHYAGTACLTRLAEQAGGAEPEGPHLPAAFSLFDRALKINPDHFRAMADRGLARSYHADREYERGRRDPSLYTAAIADFDAALAGEPTYAVVRLNRGNTLRTYAHVTAGSGGDPWPLYDRALADHRALVEQAPDIVEGLNSLGLTYWARAKQQALERTDPVPELEAATRAFSRLLELRPHHRYAHANRGQVHIAHAVWQRLHRGDPRAALQLAVADLEIAHTRSTLPRAGFALAQACLELGRARAARREDPTPQLERAETLCTEALARSGADRSGHVVRAAVRAERALWAAAQGGDPWPWREQALADYDAVLQAHPGDVTTLMNRGKTRAEEGQRRRRAGGNGRPLVEAAIADFGAILERNPRATTALYNRSLCRTELATQRAQAGEPYQALLHAAVEDVRAAVGVNPRYWEAQFQLGHLLELGKQPAQALAAFRAASAVVPNHPAIGRRIARLEAQLGGGR